MTIVKLGGTDLENTIDVTIANHGSIVIVTPLTQAAMDWVDENVSKERQAWGDGFAVESRYADDLICGMRADGLSVE